MKTKLFVVAFLLVAAAGQVSHAQFGFPKIPTPKFPKIPTPKIPRPKLPKVPKIRLPDPRRWSQIENNRGQVKASIRRGWNSRSAMVVFGQEVDHQRQKGMAEAIAASVVTANPGPAAGYLKVLAIEQKRAFLRNGRREARQVVQRMSTYLLERLFRDALSRRVRTIRIHNAAVQVGIAAYRHWKRIIVDYPQINRGRISWKRYRKTIPLPNTHQPYIRVRLNIRR